MRDKIFTLDEIKYNLNEIFKNTEVKSAILFGSYAKKKATSTSDIDLIIDSEKKIMGFKLFSLISKIEEVFNKEVDAFEKSEIIENSDIYNEIKKNGVIVYEK